MAATCKLRGRCGTSCELRVFFCVADAAFGEDPACVGHHFSWQAQYLGRFRVCSCGACGEWNVNVQCGMWSVKCRMWSVKCRMWSVECRLWRVKRGVWIGQFLVASVCFKVKSVECGVNSAQCRVWSAECQSQV